jgi:hypothetical protein
VQPEIGIWAGPRSSVGLYTPSLGIRPVMQIKRSVTPVSLELLQVHGKVWMRQGFSTTDECARARLIWNNLPHGLTWPGAFTILTEDKRHLMISTSVTADSWSRCGILRPDLSTDAFCRSMQDERVVLLLRYMDHRGVTIEASPTEFCQDIVLVENEAFLVDPTILTPIPPPAH